MEHPRQGAPFPLGEPMEQPMGIRVDAEGFAGGHGAYIVPTICSHVKNYLREIGVTVTSTTPAESGASWRKAAGARSITTPLRRGPRPGP